MIISGDVLFLGGLKNSSTLRGFTKSLGPLRRRRKKS